MVIFLFNFIFSSSFWSQGEWHKLCINKVEKKLRKKGENNAGDSVSIVSFSLWRTKDQKKGVQVVNRDVSIHKGKKITIYQDNAKM